VISTLPSACPCGLADPWREVWPEVASASGTGEERQVLEAGSREDGRQGIPGLAGASLPEHLPGPEGLHPVGGSAAGGGLNATIIIYGEKVENRQINDSRSCSRAINF
jgi:hypothetical protein